MLMETTMTDLLAADPHKQGYDAYFAKVMTNPYEDGTEEAYHWDNGWEDARHDHREEMDLLEAYEDDGQPDEMQEWHDYDPDC